MIRGRLDYLGLEVIPEEMNDVCDVIRESTNIDPRREIYFSKKGSLFEKFSDDAMIQPNYIPARGERKRHPLDRVSCEEVIQRRDLAEKRWDNRVRKLNRKSRKTAEEEREVDNVKKYFFPEKSE